LHASSTSYAPAEETKSKDRIRNDLKFPSIVKTHRQFEGAGEKKKILNLADSQE
jgi:hypothetical protein